MTYRKPETGSHGIVKIKFKKIDFITVYKKYNFADLHLKGTHFIGLETNKQDSVFP